MRQLARWIELRVEADKALLAEREDLGNLVDENIPPHEKVEDPHDAVHLSVRQPFDRFGTDRPARDDAQDVGQVKLTAGLIARIFL